MLAARAIDDNTILVYLLTIIKNLSFEIANEIFLAFSPNIMRHLVSLAHITSASYGIHGPLTEVSHLVFGALTGISRYIDVTGRRRGVCDMWVEDVIGNEIFTHTRSKY